MGTPPRRAPEATAFRTREHVLAIPGLLAILLAGLFVYPGTHFLTSDTQIWAVMMENQLHPEFLSQDLLAQFPHVGLSFYDEIVNGLRRASGLSIETVMYAHLVLFRGVMLGSAYLLGFALCQSRLLALWIAASLQMVYFIAGPTVCVMEVEPVPRGFSLALGMLAVALLAYGKRWSAAWALAAAMLFQAVMVYPILLCLAAWTVFSRDEDGLRKRLRYWLPVIGMAAAVFTLSIAAQGGSGGLFSVVPEWLREVQRVRASYNWISLWPGSLIALHVALCLLTAWAGTRLGTGTRLGNGVAPGLRWFLWGIPAVALVSIPVAWLLMERLHLMAAAQTQPARALATMYAVGLAILFSAGVLAARDGRWLACGGWLLCGYSIVFLDRSVLAARHLVEGVAGGPGLALACLWVPALTAVAVMLLWLKARAPVAATALFCVLMAVPFGIYRLHFGLDVPARDARTPEVLALSAWAAQHTPREAIFLFPGFERSLQPGVFRAVARRAVYVDWKSGGQVNFDIEFARLWWERWNDVGKGRFQARPATRYAARGIDYLVVPPADSVPALEPVFINANFVVYRASALAATVAAPAAR